MSGPNEETVRRACEVISRSESVDTAMDELEGLIDPEIEWVNPADAIERGTRRGLAGMRAALENFYGGQENAATLELEQVLERGERVFVRLRVHVKEVGQRSGGSRKCLGP